MRISVSAPTCKEVGSWHICPYNKKKVDKLKINGFSRTWKHCSCKANSHALVRRDGYIQRDTDKKCSPSTEVAAARNCWQHLNGHLEKLLEAECGLVWEWETAEDHILRKPLRFLWALSPGTTPGSSVKLQKDLLMALAGKRKSHQCEICPKAFSP